MGAALQQKRPRGGWQPLGFFSRKLSAAEEKYSTFDRELLACVAALRHFRFVLEGRSFHIETDHKPLTFALHRISDPWSARQQRHLAYVAEFTADLRHVAGVKNVVADTLSRPAAAVTAASPTEPVQWRMLAEAQATCQVTQKLAKSSTLQVVVVHVEGAAVWCEQSTGVLRPIVPAEHRRSVFNSIHNIAHPGTRATCRMVSARFVWPGQAADVKEWCRQCTNCGRAKAGQGEKTEIQKINIPATRFSHVHVDLVGPWPPSSAGHTHILTVIDRSTRWPEACPLGETTAEAVLDAFIDTWVARFGMPARVTTDRGPQFSSATWRTWCKKNGVQHVMTTAYHPQANGMVERLHRQIKDALRVREGSRAWKNHLPWVMLGIRAAPKEESNISAAEAALGHHLTVPGEFLPPPEQPLLEPLERPGVIPATRREYNAKQTRRCVSLENASWVYVRRGAPGGPLADKNGGPYEVLKRGPKTFVLRMGDREEILSRDRLAAYTAEEPPKEAAPPPRRGRPPGTGGSSGQLPRTTPDGPGGAL